MYFICQLFVQPTSESETQHHQEWMESDFKGCSTGFNIGPTLILGLLFNYADDNCLSYAGNNVELIEKTLTSDTDALRKWFKENSLEANPVKVQSMLISYLNEMFNVKKCPHDLRDDFIVERPRVNSVNFGLKSFKSYGAKIWNALLMSYKSVFSIHDFKTIIKSWDGPKCRCVICNLFMN